MELGVLVSTPDARGPADLGNRRQGQRSTAPPGAPRGSGASIVMESTISRRHRSTAMGPVTVLRSSILRVHQSVPGSAVSWCRSGLNFAHFWAAESISTIGSQFTAVAVPLLAALSLGASPQAVGRAGSGRRICLICSLAIRWGLGRSDSPPPIDDCGRCRPGAGSWRLFPSRLFAGVLSMELLIVIAFVVASGTVIFDTAYLAYVPALVEKDKLVEANSRLEASASAAQVIGPSLAGSVVRWSGRRLPWQSMRFRIWFQRRYCGAFAFPSALPEQTSDKRDREASAGVESVLRDPILRSLSLATGLVNLGGYLFLAVYVLYLTRSLGLGPEVVGLVFAAGGVGALVGSVLALVGPRSIGYRTTLISRSCSSGCLASRFRSAVLFPRYAVAVDCGGRVSAVANAPCLSHQRGQPPSVHYPTSSSRPGQ